MLDFYDNGNPNNGSYIGRDYTDTEGNFTIPSNAECVIIQKEGYWTRKTNVANKISELNLIPKYYNGLYVDMEAYGEIFRHEYMSNGTGNINWNLDKIPDGRLTWYIDFPDDKQQFKEWARKTIEEKLQNQINVQLTQNPNIIYGTPPLITTREQGSSVPRDEGTIWMFYYHNPGAAKGLTTIFDSGLSSYMNYGDRITRAKIRIRDDADEETFLVEVGHAAGAGSLYYFSRIWTKEIIEK